MENVANAIRADRPLEREMFDLAGEARRLRSALALAQRWLEVAMEEDETGLMTAKAEYTRDQLEEELSKTVFRMEVSKRRRQLRDAPPVEDPDGIKCAVRQMRLALSARTVSSRSVGRVFSQ